MRRDAGGPHQAAENHDDHRRGPGAAQAGGRTLRAGPADVGVVEQHHASAGDAGAQCGWHDEGARGGSHVADGLARAHEQSRPAHAGERRLDIGGQTRKPGEG